VVERVQADHYFDASESGEFSELVDIADADTFSITANAIWPTGNLEDGEITLERVICESQKETTRAHNLDSTSTFHEVSPIGSNRDA
jgi:hypothetical protein